MAPPTTGPTEYETAKTIDNIPKYFGVFGGGTSSKPITVDTENVPDPPIPWKARNTILVLHENGFLVS